VYIRGFRSKDTRTAAENVRLKTALRFDGCAPFPPAPGRPCGAHRVLAVPGLPALCSSVHSRDAGSIHRSGDASKPGPRIDRNLFDRRLRHSMRYPEKPAMRQPCSTRWRVLTSPGASTANIFPIIFPEPAGLDKCYVAASEAGRGLRGCANADGEKQPPGENCRVNKSGTHDSEPLAIRVRRSYIRSCGRPGCHRFRCIARVLDKRIAGGCGLGTQCRWQSRNQAACLSPPS
jgi:hypothetical protein